MKFVWQPLVQYLCATSIARVLKATSQKRKTLEKTVCTRTAALEVVKGIKNLSIATLLPYCCRMLPYALQSPLDINKLGQTPWNSERLHGSASNKIAQHCFQLTCYICSHNIHEQTRVPFISWPPWTWWHTTCCFRSWTSNCIKMPN
jgi:hypothetical protein